MKLAPLPLALLLFSVCALTVSCSRDPELKKRAEAGDVDAQSSLGVMYDNGTGVPEDDVEAVKWYRLAADQGYASAQYNLGFKYATGDGVLEDAAETVKWYRLAAEWLRWTRTGDFRSF